jgi:hypothetical protein
LLACQAASGFLRGMTAVGYSSAAQRPQRVENHRQVDPLLK